MIYREEVVAMLVTVANLNVKLRRIIDLLEEEFDGGEAIPEDDA